jgi:pimeloyl-ACP methyl ester carboxylesterase
MMADRCAPLRILAASAALLLATPLTAGGEAGPISLRDQGFFWVGVHPTSVQTTGPNGATATGTTIQGQMYVGFQLPAEKRHPYPLVLVHGGGGQATDWMGTPDGRDGWLDYFLAAGFDVYFVDRPGLGRSPNTAGYPAAAAPPTTELIANVFTARSKQYPGGGAAGTPEVASHTASSEPGTSAPDAVLKDDLAELLDRIGPAILVTHSNGGPSGWLAMEARPDLVKGVLAIEPVGISPQLAHLLTFSPALPSDMALTLEQRPSEGEGLDPCSLQPASDLRTVPAFAGKPILFVGSPESMFTPNIHCAAQLFAQLGADTRLARLTDYGLEGNGHFMNEELNNGAIATRVFIPWLETIR